jgi:hypothetical protein
MKEEIDDLPNVLIINRKVYRHDSVNETAYRLLASALNLARGEGYYDPTNEAAGRICREIADMLGKANEILKFRR